MSNVRLEFVPVHRYITVEGPDKQLYQVRVNFSVMTFFAVAEICRELGIRHPEELSLLRSPLDKEGYAKLTGWAKKGRKVCLATYVSKLFPALTYPFSPISLPPSPLQDESVP